MPCAARSRAHVIASLSAFSYESWSAPAKNKKRESEKEARSRSKKKEGKYICSDFIRQG
jgi:hypothetical protein